MPARGWARQQERASDTARQRAGEGERAASVRRCGEMEIRAQRERVGEMMTLRAGAGETVGEGEQDEVRGRAR